MPAALQLAFFDAPAPPPAQMHSPTSREAARLIEPKAGTLRRLVLAYLRERGSVGATDEEIQTALDMNPSTQRPRRIELVKAGLAFDTGVTMPTRSGRAAVIWRAR